MSGNKLLKQKTMKISEENKKSDMLISDDRTFFCSELVAKAFKVLGVIENDEISCSKFFPSHFSSKGEDFLNLTKNTTIESE